MISATWQRCRVHFIRNALAHAGRSGRRVVSALKSRLSSSEQAELARVMAYVLTKFEQNQGGKLRDGDIVDVRDNAFFMRCVAEEQGLSVYLFWIGSMLVFQAKVFFGEEGSTRGRRLLVYRRARSSRGRPWCEDLVLPKRANRLLKAPDIKPMQVLTEYLASRAPRKLC